MILANVIRTPDGTLVTSRNVHDYKEYTDANGETYMVDGGLSYIRRSSNKEPYEELSVIDTDPHEKIREWFSWGSYGIKGDQPITHIKLKDMEDAHIENCLNFNHAKHPTIKELFETELAFRKSVVGTL